MKPDTIKGENTASQDQDATAPVPVILRVTKTTVNTSRIPTTKIE